MRDEGGSKIWFWCLVLIASASLVECLGEAVSGSEAGKDSSVRMRGVKQWTLGLAAGLGFDVCSAFNAPADVPTWCGKPYQSS